MRSVKKNVNKFLGFLTSGILAAGLFGVFSLPAGAEDGKSRAVLNSGQLMQMIHAVMPKQLPVIIDKIAKGEVKRIAPSQPVWILETVSDTILYYQGQPTFAGNPASHLVDDAGFRFGQKAVQDGKGHKSSWISLKLGGAVYKAYCKSQHPFVVCTLAE